jgi:phosphoribosylamine--glycine ligase
MKIIVISKDGDALDLVLRLKAEGNDVKVAILDREYRRVGDGFGFRKIINNWGKELPWVGKEGIIIFDQSGFGKEQDELRKAGYSVVGGSEGGDKLEFDRCHAQKIFKKCGMKTVVSRHFESAEKAIEFVRKYKGCWVVKQNGHADKCFSYVGKLEDGSDVVALLQNYLHYNKKECCSIDLQQRVEGVEVGVARYFNGKNWVGPIEMNIEHKKLFPGGLGPKTSEMGTLVWYDDNENNKLFKETLSKLAPYLNKINFRGDIDINCIVNESGAVPLEATPRFGYPALHMQSMLNKSPWGEFLKAVADGREYDLKWQKGYGVVVLIAVPPFPYQSVSSKYNPEGLKIFFKERITEAEWNHIHFSDIVCNPISAKSSLYYPSLGQGGQGGLSESNDTEYSIAAKSGYALCVTGTGRTIEQARENAYRLTDKILIPKMFYRHDIGKKFIKHDRALLKKWKYV